MKVCKIKGCNNRHKGHGYCPAHLWKYKTYGDPLYSKIERHGLINTPEYGIWSSMKTRCYNKLSPNYCRYGGRGIIICARWKYSFLTFYSDMGKKPFPEAQIDRIDNNGNYEPGNCRWTTASINSQNRSSTKLSIKKAQKIRTIYSNKNISMKQLAEMYNVCPMTICHIINNRYWKEV